MLMSPTASTKRSSTFTPVLKLNLMVSGSFFTVIEDEINDLSK